MDVLRLGLVGAGEVARRHVAAAADVAEVSVVAVADPDPHRAARLAAQADASVHPDLDALLAGADVDVVVLAVPHAHHAALAVRAATAGCHVLVEKPMATTLADCDRMTAAADAAGVLLWVGQQQRQFAQVRAARDLLRGGELGAPLVYTDRRSTDYSRDGTRPAWFFDPHLAGGGVAMLVGLHSVDRAGWLLGAAPTAVAGTTATPDGWRIETDAAGTVWFDGAPPAQFALHTGPDFFHDTTVVCERGRLALDPCGLTVTDPHGVPRRVVEVDADREYTVSFARQYRALAATLRTGAAPDVTPAEGRAAVAVVLGLYMSARSGGAVVTLGGADGLTVG